MRSQRLVCLSIVSALATLGLSVGCNSRDASGPTFSSPTSVVTDGAPQPEGLVQEAATVAATTPTIHSISGVTNSVGLSNGVVSLTCGLAVVNGARVVNDQAGVYRWTISGVGFGRAGSVTVAGRPAPVVSWSDWRIVIDPTVPWNSGPISTLLVIRTNTGAVATKGLQIAPSLRSRVYGQCTHFVALRRLQTGREPSPTAYGGHTSITASWVPQPGDILNFGPGSHTAFVESVGRKFVEQDGTTVYPLQVSDQNGDCRGSIRTTATFFKVRGGTVRMSPQSSATRLGVAASFYRGR